MQFQAINPKVEVNGQTVLSVVEGMASFKDVAYDILAKHGIKDPKPGEWYNQQNWLDAFKEIAEEIGDFTLNSIGKKIPENADWPPTVNSVETALSSIDIAYHMNHRLDGKVLFNPENGQMKEGIGHYGYEKLEGNNVKMVCDNPYPCDFDKGIIEAAANKFKSGSEIVTIKQEGDCRKAGKETCTYLISW
jgi:hypothetical protein